MNKPINWFEIPATDLDRAAAFYETILQVQLNRGKMGNGEMAVFPYDREAATGGCLQKEAGVTPSKQGTVIYLNAGFSLNSVLERVAPAGGEVLLPRTELPSGMGAYAHIADTEGNRVGIHGLA
ncbi:MAG: VOC family protein [Acidobacteria bacterium]|nr:VOC family protein [Acidobacteriota bacterium]